MEPFLEEPRTRITARVSDIVRTTLEQAAELSGATVNQFVVQTAYLEAQRLIERETVIRLSLELELFLPVRTIQEALNDVMAARH